MGKNRDKQAKALLVNTIGLKADLKQLVKDVSGLYKDGTITNFKTAQNLIDGLSKRGTGQIKAKAKIEELNKPPIIQNANIENPKDVLTTITFHTNYRPNIQTSSLTEMYNDMHKAVLNKVLTVLKEKKSMKIKMGVSFEIYREITKKEGGGNKHKADPASRTEEIVDDFGKKVMAEIKLTTKHYTTKPVVIQSTDATTVLRSQADKLGGDMQFLNEQGSEWRIYKVLFLYIQCFTIKPQRGSSYIPVPSPFNNAKCGLINIKNDDQKCFQWNMKYHQSPKD